MGEKVVLWVKAILTLLGAIFLAAVHIADPANLITLTGKSDVRYDDGAKAASFALIAALAIAVQRMPTGKSRDEKSINLVVWVLAATSAFLAAWYWLADETDGDPWPYLEEILVIGGLVVLTVVIPIAVGALFGWLNKRRRERDQKSD